MLQISKKIQKIHYVIRTGKNASILKSHTSCQVYQYEFQFLSQKANRLENVFCNQILVCKMNIRLYINNLCKINPKADQILKTFVLKMQFAFHFCWILTTIFTILIEFKFQVKLKVLRKFFGQWSAKCSNGQRGASRGHPFLTLCGCR